MAACRVSSDDGKEALPDAINSIKFSKFLSGNGMSSLQTAVNRQAVCYEADISNAFSVYDDTYTILSGSMSDGVGLYYGYGRDKASSDSDYVTVSKSLPVIENSRQYEGDGLYFIRIPDPEHVGYARLKVGNQTGPDFLNISKQCQKGPDGALYLSSSLFVERIARRLQTTGSDSATSSFVHGPALNVDLTPNQVADLLESDTDSVLRTEDPSFRSESATGVDKTDIVICLESETWPSETDGWRNRKRQSDWPSVRLMDQITQTGCILAPVGCKESDQKDMQWRISFNKAEALLVKSFNTTQMHCYVLLKILCNEVLKKVSEGNITSYIIKTTLFWALESIPLKDWRDDSLIPCFQRCIIKLRKWIDQRFMPNYFIEDRNMFLLSELTESIARVTVHCLDKIAENPVEALSELELLDGVLTKTGNELDIDIQFMDIFYWINGRIDMAEKYYYISNKILHQAYHRTNIQQSTQQCQRILQELDTLGGYTEPMSKLVQNCLGVLHYVRSFQQDSVEMILEKNISMEYFETSKDVDCFHAPLRMITCMMSDKIDLDRIDQMLRKTGGVITLLSESHTMGFKHNKEMFLTACSETLMALKEKKSLDVLQKLHTVVEEDIQIQNIQKTAESFKSIPEAECFYMVFACLWKELVFMNVVFMAAEKDILPKPIRFEAEMQMKGESLYEFGLPEIKVSTVESPFAVFHPYIYHKFLTFLFDLENGMDIKKCTISLCRLQKAIDTVPEKGKVTGYNFLAYAYTRMCDYKRATACVMQSLSLQPDYNNVAFYHLITVYNALVKIQLDREKAGDATGEDTRQIL